MLFYLKSGRGKGILSYPRLYHFSGFALFIFIKQSKNKDELDIKIGYYWFS